MKPAAPHLRPRAQSGVTLVEALVALLIMAFGMVAMVGLQGNMRRSADVAKQRSEAVRLAQRELETLRAYSVLEPPDPPQAGVRSYAQILDPDDARATDTSSNTSFGLTRSATDPDDQGLASVAVRVDWMDRANGASFVLLSSLIARADPRLGGALGIAPDGSPTRRPRGRAATIPVAAKDLGNGQSIFKPPATSSGVAWVFDNRSGTIVKRCTGLAPDAQNAELSLTDLATYCNNDIAALLLSGHVRFATEAGVEPDPITPVSAALPLDLVIVAADNLDPIPAAPSYECFDNAPASPAPAQTEGVSYYCAVFPAATTPPSWSGRLKLSGIPLGDAGYKICRYSADYDGDTKISNAEHPLNYVGVTSALVRQNFLVIRASRSCPLGHAPDPEHGYFFNSATVEHQSLASP